MAIMTQDTHTTMEFLTVKLKLMKYLTKNTFTNKITSYDLRLFSTTKRYVTNTLKPIVHDESLFT